MVTDYMLITVFSLLGVISMVIPSMVRLRRSEALGISILIIGMLAINRDLVVAYTVSVAISGYFYSMFSGQEVFGKTRFLKFTLCLLCGMLLALAGKHIAHLALYMRSGGLFFAVFTVIFIYIFSNKNRRAEIAAGLFVGMCVYYIFTNVGGLFNVSFTGERGLMIAIVAFLILPKIYIGRLWGEQEIKPSAGIFIAIPILFFTSIPINFSSSVMLAAFNNSSVITGGYRSIQDGNNMLLTISILIALVSVTVVLVSIVTLKKYKIAVPETAVRFGRPFLIALTLTILYMNGTGLIEISIAAFLSFVCFTLYKSYITPEAVFYGYSLCAIIREESVKIGILSTDMGIFQYFATIPLYGYAAIALIAFSAVIANGWSRTK